MPIYIKTIEDTGAQALIHTCDKCGAPAFFGIGVSLRKALNAAVKGKIELAKELLGQWYCGDCWRLLK